ncbi:helix-turn-helix domain-containing protein [Tellurirhabdus rosea]|uniref:helix-turn-helix domain-containing protein n=1 Tax=Tellurirhabdus rosea TaxID=2674997 RepID=UPI00225C3204|nr:helix-turn-helix transcriptional regulator [Tellurirhabdus rosea]
MSINDKIKLLLKDRNLTPSVFADEIGVNRASISHILSGRNRPSYDIIQKILRRFPDLGTNWMLEDEEQNNVVNYDNRFSNPPSGRRNNLQPEIAPLVQPKPVASKPEAVPDTIVNQEPGAVSKQIERILIFYTDGTFKEYSPS